VVFKVNPSTYRADVAFTAVVTPAPLDGETITLERGSTVLGTGVLKRKCRVPRLSANLKSGSFNRAFLTDPVET
jgi:hypothetical protein